MSDACFLPPFFTATYGIDDKRSSKIADILLLRDNCMSSGRIDFVAAVQITADHRRYARPPAGAGHLQSFIRL